MTSNILDTMPPAYSGSTSAANFFDIPSHTQIIPNNCDATSPAYSGSATAQSASDTFDLTSFPQITSDNCDATSTTFSSSMAAGSSGVSDVPPLPQAASDVDGATAVTNTKSDNKRCNKKRANTLSVRLLQNFPFLLVVNSDSPGIHSDYH